LARELEPVKFWSEKRLVEQHHMRGVSRSSHPAAIAASHGEAILIHPTTDPIHEDRISSKEPKP